MEPIHLKVRRKYLVGKVPGHPAKPRTNNKGVVSLESALYSQWLALAANRVIHTAMKTKLAQAPVLLFDRKGGRLLRTMPREQYSNLWGKR